MSSLWQTNQKGSKTHRNTDEGFNPSIAFPSSWAPANNEKKSTMTPEFSSSPEETSSSTSDGSRNDCNVSGQVLGSNSTDEEKGDRASTSEVSQQTTPWCKRKNTFVALVLSATILIIGIIVSGALLGTRNNGSSTNSNSQRPGPASHEGEAYELIHSEVNKSAGNNGNEATLIDDNASVEPEDQKMFSTIVSVPSNAGNVTPQTKSESTMAPTSLPSRMSSDTLDLDALDLDGIDVALTSSCSDDPTWRLNGYGKGGNIVPTTLDCAWVAKYPTNNCDRSGISTLASINRVENMIIDATTACCRACSQEMMDGTKPSRPTSKPIVPVNPAPKPASKPSPMARPIRSPVPRDMCKSTAEDTDADVALPFEGGVEVGSVNGRKLSEASGLVASQANPGILWTHNDAPKRQSLPNESNRIYAIEANSGMIVAEYILAGATNIDWEDMAYGPGPVPGMNYLYIGDVGDNDERRSSITIYRVPEPIISSKDEGVMVLSNWSKLRLRYLDGRGRNVEAFLLDPISQRLYLFTKEGGNIWSTQDPWGRGDFSMTLSRSGVMKEFRNQPLVSADISADGFEVLLKHYGAIRYLCRDPNVELERVFASHYPVKLQYNREPKGEAVAIDDEGMYTLAEGGGRLSVPLYFYKRAR